MRRALATLLLFAAVGCGSAPPPPPAPPSGREAPRLVFDAVAPSVVAVLNDDKADREEEMKLLLKSFGDESKAPKKIIDVSLRKEPMPHGTGFMIEGGLVITAAHVVMRPDRLKITTRSGQTVEATLDRIDEVRDVAVLRPKEPLKDVPPLAIDPGDIKVGEPVWALGHTGQGLWALSWGISEGIASGVVDLLGVKLLLFDAPVYPGFSGGPVVRLDHGTPKVIGVNHAILFTGGMVNVASISSATSVAEIRDVVAGVPHPLEVKLAEYAKGEKSKQYADLFVTQSLSVFRDASGQQTAHIFGNAQSIETGSDGMASVPVVAMAFRLPPGQSDVEFDLKDPDGKVVSSSGVRPVIVSDKQRVSFVSHNFHFQPAVHGRYEITARVGQKPLGSSTVAVSLKDDDNELVDTHDSDVSDDGDPDVDVVVAGFGNDNPLALLGVQSTWAEKSYPRRVSYSWFARGTRGWSGTNVAINAFVLDPAGHVVGRGVGCYNPELRPEHPWSCVGTGGTPLMMKEGPYDLVFTINDRPVAMWPMEATLRADDLPGSDIERWLKDVKRNKATKHPAHASDSPAAPIAPKGPPAKK